MCSFFDVFDQYFVFVFARMADMRLALAPGCYICHWLLTKILDTDFRRFHCKCDIVSTGQDKQCDRFENKNGSRCTKRIVINGKRPMCVTAAVVVVVWSSPSTDVLIFLVRPSVDPGIDGVYVGGQRFVVAGASGAPVNVLPSTCRSTKKLRVMGASCGVAKFPRYKRRCRRPADDSADSPDNNDRNNETAVTNRLISSSAVRLPRSVSSASSNIWPWSGWQAPTRTTMTGTDNDRLQVEQNPLDSIRWTVAPFRQSPTTSR